MLNIIITGERAEGKTTLARMLRIFLNKFTKFSVELEDIGMAKESVEVYNKADDRREISDYQKLDGRRVSIVVINTLHPASSYTRSELMVERKQP